jgi:hypothetical protein
MITEEKALGQQHRHSPGAPPQLLTVKQFALAYPAFTEAAMRNLIFKAHNRASSRGEVTGNGLLKSGAIIRLGRRILIDDQAFFAWVRGNAALTGQGDGAGASPTRSKAFRHD